MDMTYLFTLGHALMDILVEVDDSFLAELNLRKGQAHMHDNALSRRVLDKLKYTQAKLCAGGGAANTAAAFAMLGGKVVLCSTIGNDEYGVQYEQETLAAGVTSKLKISGSMTGHCIVLITPDAQRTFVVNYAAASVMAPEDISEQDILASSMLHIEGYMLDNPHTRPVVLHALTLARTHNKKISLDLSDPGVVTRNREQLTTLLKDVHIVFANEEEALALTGKPAEEAAAELAQFCNIAVVKRGEHGSLIRTKETTTHIAAIPTKVLDTTGAGDAYAAGFLYGLSKNLSLKESGELASVLASKVVSQVGARLTPEVISPPPARP